MSIKHFLLLKGGASELVDLFTGTYTAVAGGECLVVLTPEAGGWLGGSFTAEGQTLEVRGRVFEAGDQVTGFLLEPTVKAPVALFRAQLKEGGLALQLDVPDFDELLERCTLERIVLNRLVADGSEGVSD